MGFYFQIALQFTITVFTLWALAKNRTKPWVFLSLASLLMTLRRMTAFLAHQGQVVGNSISLADQLWLPATISILQVVALIWLYKSESRALERIKIERYSFENASVPRARVAKSGQIIECNTAFAKFLRRTKEEICSPDWTWMQVTPEYYLVIDLELLQRLEGRVIDSYDLNKPYDVEEGLRNWGTLTVIRAEGDNKNDPVTEFYDVIIREIGLQSTQEKHLEEFDQFYRDFRHGQEAN